ncbi:unnamed protein product [Calicophoron daubneyi]|uniref:Uncharacterized protein n=1 Tax=Calicophoron daubneyi TaxID=300641 RepID=A0AAV2TRR0_CALDB
MEVSMAEHHRVNRDRNTVAIGKILRQGFFAGYSCNAMLRRLISLRPSMSSEGLATGSFISRLRRHPVLWTCVSSGLLYRGYLALPRRPIVRKSNDRKSLFYASHNDFVFHSNSGIPSHESTGDSRAVRMNNLRQAVEHELPAFFEKNWLDVPSELFDSSTVFSLQLTDGRVHKIRNRSCLHAVIIASRAYFSARCYHCRLELLNVLPDTDKWKLEVGFRIIMLPSPSFGDLRLSSEELMRRLEQNARWDEFRATFFLSENGEVSEVHLTKFLPPSKPTETLKNLRQLALLKRLAPSLPSTRRLPTPTPFMFPYSVELAVSDVTLDNFIWILPDQEFKALNDPMLKVSRPLFLRLLEICRSHPASVFDRFVESSPSDKTNHSAFLTLCPYSVKVTSLCDPPGRLATTRFSGHNFPENSRCHCYCGLLSSFPLTEIRTYTSGNSNLSSSVSSPNNHMMDETSSSQTWSFYSSFLPNHIEVGSAILPWLIREIPSAAAFCTLQNTPEKLCHG